MGMPSRIIYVMYVAFFEGFNATILAYGQVFRISDAILCMYSTYDNDFHPYLCILDW